MQRRSQAVCDVLLPGGGRDFFAVRLGDIKSVDGSAFFSGNLREGNVHRDLTQYLRDDKEQTQPIFSFNVHHRSVLGAVVVKMNSGRNPFSLERLVEWADGLLAGN